MNDNRKYRKAALMLLVSCTLSGCGSGERIANIGKPPDQAPITNPQLAKGYKPVTFKAPKPGL